MVQTAKLVVAPAGVASRAIALLPGLAMAGVVAFVASRLSVWETGAAQPWFGRPIAIAAPVIALMIGIAFHAAAVNHR